MHMCEFFHLQKVLVDSRPLSEDVRMPWEFSFRQWHKNLNNTIGASFVQSLTILKWKWSETTHRLHHVLCYLQTELLLLDHQQLWYKLCWDSHEAQILFHNGMNWSNADVHLICKFSDSDSVIFHQLVKDILLCDVEGVPECTLLSTNLQQFLKQLYLSFIFTVPIASSSKACWISWLISTRESLKLYTKFDAVALLKFSVILSKMEISASTHTCAVKSHL